MAYALIGFMVLTVLVLIGGVVVMARGGEINQKYSNKLMSLRVAFQAVAIAILFIVFATSA